MVGDGVNDAPAMANATVESQWERLVPTLALETADVALMADDSNHLPFVVGLSRRTSRIIRQNLWFSSAWSPSSFPRPYLDCDSVRLSFRHEGCTLLLS